ncbi:M23 family metallopeptidase [Rhodococcus opacus]|uniref:M23 family metallopeptidase n=1 Tax=Rhodococcus opacus TaxID=37919 RepID=UPI001CED4484|nr:M23 family metallopeptidase [Rhodococcus opacus]
MARHRRPEPDDLDFLRWDLDSDAAQEAAPQAGDAADADGDATATIGADMNLGHDGYVTDSATKISDTTARPRRTGSHRRSAPSRHSGRIMVLSVATGALLAAGTSTAHGSPAADAPGVDVAPQPTPDPVAQALSSVPQVLQIPQIPELSDFADQLARAREREAARAEREAAARRPMSIAPVSGTLTSNYGARWGTTHYGLDIANSIGTPIVSVTDGTVLEAGPASGFGMWVRILQDDGTIGVFGHINEALVTAGQKVRAGEQIATVGNRGQSTGPHLHYEVWQPDGRKADPLAWLNARGVQLQSPDVRG